MIVGGLDGAHPMTRQSARDDGIPPPEFGSEEVDR
jgi:hypothetical protein